MDLRERINSFTEVGELLRAALDGRQVKHASGLLNLINTQHIKNPWFTPENVRHAVKAIARELTFENLVKWTDSYPALNNKPGCYKIGVIMAGNIPLAGFHDFLSVLITGNNLIAKTSSKDPDLIPFFAGILTDINPGFREKIEITGGTISGFDAVIATGSDNSSRYFEFYFGKYPSIIRKNRNSVALLAGTETETELKSLGKDVFSYFGLGCRNVSKIFVPEKYDLASMLDGWESYSYIAEHAKYANNYDFNKAVYLVNREKFLDTGYLLLKESQAMSSPVAVLYYEYYPTIEKIFASLEEKKDKIQCVIGKDFIPFGSSQSPALWDYADGADTLDFILKKIGPGIL